MTDSIQSALIMLVVGMITVFCVLLLLVAGAKLLIFIVNKFFSDPPESSPENSLHAAKVVAITSAVEIVTEGRGRIESIEKI